MDIRKGDRIWVNVAPFIGSVSSGKDWIPCEVLGTDEECVLVATEAPYRRVELWVSCEWIEGYRKSPKKLMLT